MSTMMYDRRSAPAIQPNTDGSLTIQYIPAESGVHELSLSFNENPVEGTPLRVNVDASDNDKVISAYGSGLFTGSSGIKQEFYVVSGHPMNAIEVVIDGPCKAEVVKRLGPDGIMIVEYIPLCPGEYSISLKFNNKHIHGSPFSAIVSGEGRKKSHISFPGSSDYPLGGSDVGLKNLTGQMTLPDKTVEPCMLKKMDSGKLGISSFQPRTKGLYVVTVTQDGEPFTGSPFQIHVGEQELCTASRVKVSGATRQATANVWNEIKLDVSEAGFGSFGVTIEGNHSTDIESKSASPTEHTVQFRPHEPGVYLLTIRFGEDQIPGSPFLLNVSGEPSGKLRALVTKQIQSGEIVVVGQACTINLTLPGMNPLDMEATVTSPSGASELCEIRDLPDNLYEIKFSPTEVGLNIISLKQKGIHVSGSPFQYSVGKVPPGGTHKVEFGGPGADRGGVGIKNIFNIYTHEAGPGMLSVAIDGPSKADLQIIDTGTGYVTISYVVDVEGEYSIGVKYNDEHVPKSPRKVHIDPECKEAKQVTVHGLRDRGMEVDKPATFQVNLNGVKGVLKSFSEAPSGLTEETLIQELDSDLYTLRFFPKENGVYHINVKFNDAHIPGSPFAMLVGKLGADPALVQAKGKGLEKGEVGKAVKFEVYTANSGSGLLFVSIDGPTKVPMTCTELEEGYEFSYNPRAPGDYFITIKYCHVQVAGSPFKSVVTGRLKGKLSDSREVSNLYIDTVEKKPGTNKSKQFQGDPTKVVVQGTGLKKGFIGRAGTFTVEIKEAGQGLLAVSMISSSGNPVKELTLKKQKVGVYIVTYLPEEKGDHILNIRWGASDVPGSPFVLAVS